jgi:CRISPR-associated endonuclease Csn1
LLGKERNVGYVLGLDLGSNSIGWAMVDEEARAILRSGARVFPEGVGRDKGREVSKNENRRIKRGMRRQIERRAGRKWNLTSTLVAAGLLPGADILKRFQDLRERIKKSFNSVVGGGRDYRRELHQEIRKFRKELVVCVGEIAGKMDPWALRAKALDGRLELHEIGRVLIHLNQRRGFLSNRKTDKPDNDKSEMLKEINELQQQIEASGCRTLGEYLHKQRVDAGEPERVRIRGKHTRRAMLIHEFNCIWEAQAKFHPKVMTEDLRRKIGDRKKGILFFQRDLYGALVGECELEKGQRRCPKADRLAQKFRLFQEVNNLRVIDNNGEEWTFGDPDRKEIRAKLIAFLSCREKAEFDLIKSELGLLDGVRFNLERGKRKTMQGMAVDARLAADALFGEGWWARDEAERDGIVRSLLKDDDETLREKAVRDWGLVAR